MSEINKILESGILESYCLGAVSNEEIQLVEKYISQHSEIREEIDAIRKGIEHYAGGYKIDPPPVVRESILNEIDRLIAQKKVPGKLSEFIEINEHSRAEEWQERVKGIKPPDQYEIHLHNLYSDKDNFLFMAFVNRMVPVEIHEDIYESFLILEGTCTCKVGDEYIDLKAGDYFSIPLYKEHSIKVTSDIPVKAILQRKMSA